jgi:hypothetical protein
MKVTEIKKYVYKGVEYPSLEAIKEKLHDTIGTEVLDTINKQCPPANHKDFTKMLDILCDPKTRRVLLECYTTTIDVVDEWDNEETINILDV